MITSALSSELVGTGLSWMLTYLIHSTIAILAVWLLCRGIKPIAARIGPGGENLAWKLALTAAFVSATVQIGVGVRPALGAFEFESGPARVEQRPVEPERARLVVVDEHERVLLGTVPRASAEPAAEPEPAPVWPELLLIAWAIGAALTSYRLIACARSLRRRLKDRSPVLEDPLLESFLTLCRDAEIERKIELTQSRRIASPIALWRREIVLPERAVTELPPAAIRSILAHELAHLERRDPHWLALAAVIEALCFFQPLNRLARRGMQESAELLCDDWAIAHTGDGVAFAKSLAEVASWEQAKRSSTLLTGMISGERPLVRRVRRALDGDPQRFEAEHSPRPTRMLVGIGSLAALIMIAPGAVNASPPASKAPAKRELAKQHDEAPAVSEAAAPAPQQPAEEARQAAPTPAPEPAPTGSHLIIRDGDEYLIIDANGLRLRSKDAELDILDGQNPRMRMRVREGAQQLDFDLELDVLTNMALEMLTGELFGEFGAPMPAPPHVRPLPSLPGFDLDPLEALGGFGSGPSSGEPERDGPANGTISL